MKHWGKVVKWLTLGKFDKVWKGKNKEAFDRFLEEQAEPAGGFVLTFPLSDGGLFWFFYKLIKNEGDKLIFESPEIYVPDEDDNQEGPPEYKGYPIWRVNAEIAGVALNK